MGNSSPGVAAVTASPPGLAPELTIVIPAHNEAARLPTTLDTLRRFLDDWGLDYQILVVDDGSRDGTAGLTEGRGPRFSTHSLSRNRGKGAAVRAGMLQARGQMVAYLDADLSCGTHCLRQGYEILQAGGPDLVLGARNIAGSEVDARRPWLRKTASAVFRGLTHCLISDEVSDSQAGFKMFRRSAGQMIFSRTTLDGFAFDAEVIFLIHHLGLVFVQVPVDLIGGRESTLSLRRHTLPMLWDVLRVHVRGRCGWYGPRALSAVAADATTNAAR